jgi:Fe-Mn family superoxide dismutase
MGLRVTRREAVKTLVGGGLAMAAFTFTDGGRAMAEPTAGASPMAEGVAPAYRGTNAIKALPFNPAKLKGLSEKLLLSHHRNNYAGAVKRLNEIQQEIGALSKDAAPYHWGALKREELIATNSMLLHDRYFGNLGGDGKASGTIVRLIGARYGNVATWEAEFRRTGLSLGGGAGWVILDFSPHDAAVHTYWAGDHTQSLAWGTPLLVMDMYEHAYQMDYGADAGGYVDAFFQNVNWDEVNRRAESVGQGG